MSFESPLYLLALLLVPAAALAYVRADRARRRAAEAFAAPRMLPSVAPLRPGWRRHAPMALYGTALVGLALALAKPEATVAVPEERASVMLAIDGSGSMQARDVSPTRLDAARGAAAGFLDDVPDELRVGGAIFNHEVQSASAPSSDREGLRRRIEALRPSGGTATGDALAASLRLLARGGAPANRDEPANREPPAAIVLLSDGASTHGRDPLEPAREAAARDIPIYSVALGTDAGTIEVETPSGNTRVEPVPPDRETLRTIARLTGGRYYEAADAPELDQVYERLGSQVSTRPERREITAAFAAGAALLVLAGGGLSLRWFGRLP